MKGRSWFVMAMLVSVAWASNVSYNPPSYPGGNNNDSPNAVTNNMPGQGLAQLIQEKTQKAQKIFNDVNYQTMMGSDKAAFLKSDDSSDSLDPKTPLFHFDKGESDGSQ